MNEAASICQARVAAHKRVASDRRPVHLHSQCVYDHVLGRLVQLRMHQGHEVIASYHIAQGTESLLHSCDLNTVG